MNGRRAALRREPAPPSPFTCPKEHGTTQTVIAPRGDARAFFIHFTGGGLDDDRYAVQRFRSMANGDIVPIHADGTKPKGWRKARPTTVSVKTVEKMRPARDEIIIATGGRLRGSGGRFWVWCTMGIFTDRRQRG